jgi:hypothetical protein
MSKRKKMTEVLEAEMLAIAKEKGTLQSMEAAQKKKARKEVKKAACSAVLMDLSKKFTTASKTWAVAPNEELEPPSLGLSTPNLSYFDRYHKFDPVYLFEKLCPPPLLDMIVGASEKCCHLLIVEKREKGITPDRHWNKPITLPELCRYLGVTWFWTLKYSTKSYKKVLKEMKQDPVLTACQKELLIPYKHYTMLNICLDVDVVQFAWQLSISKSMDGNLAKLLLQMKPSSLGLVMQSSECLSLENCTLLASCATSWLFTPPNLTASHMFLVLSFIGLETKATPLLPLNLPRS